MSCKESLEFNNSYLERLPNMKTSDLLRAILPNHSQIMSHSEIAKRINHAVTCASVIVNHELTRANSFLVITHGDVERAIELADQEEAR